MHPLPVKRTNQEPQLSVVINTLNEEANLEDCLESVKDMADEIVVVDMHSDDRTVEIARRYTDRIFFHERTGVVEPAREFAIQQAAGDWIFILDADERVTRELACSIRDVISDPGGIDIFRIPRRNYIAGRWMEGSGFGVDVERQPRLFRKGALSWPDRIHALPVMHGEEGLLPLPLEARIDHLAYDDLFDFVDRLNRYTDHECRSLERDGKKWSLELMLTAALKEAVERYDPGTDGVHSLVLAVSMAYYRFLTWAKLWEKQGYPQEPLPADIADLVKLILDPGTADLKQVQLQAPESRRTGEPEHSESLSPRSSDTNSQIRPGYGTGFHEDEGLWRWMGHQAKIMVPADALPVEVAFTLVCLDARYYDPFPFVVEIFAGDRHLQTVTFDESNQRVPVRVVLENDTPILLKSSSVFIPVELGLGPDARILSVQVVGLSAVCGESDGSPRRDSAHSPARPAVRLGLIIADSTAPEKRCNTDSPLAFGYFVSYLREKMPECEVLFRYTIDDLLAENVDIVGISSSTEEFELAKCMAREVKERSDIPVIVGGVHITVIPPNLTPQMDIAVLGEGEVTLHELLQCFKERGKRFPPEDLRRIPGIAFRDNGALFQTQPRPPIKSLDSLPFPDRKAIGIGLPSDRAFLFTSRGCPYRCIFCASSRFWQNLRYFSADYVVREIEHIHRDLGVSNAHFFDDLFITPRSRIREICRLIDERGLNKEMAFSGAVHAHLVDRELCDMLGRMNVVEVMFGAESFSPGVLDYLKSGTATPEDNQRTIDLLNEYGIRPNLSLIYGAPGETREDLQTTFRALEENLRAGKIQRWQRGRLRLYPGTPIWDEALKRGIVSEGMNWNEVKNTPARHYLGPMPEEEFSRLLRDHEERCIEIASDNWQMWREWGLSREEVIEVLARRRPDLVASYVDFSKDHTDAQMGDGWHSLEGPDGNRSRWMGKESAIYLKGNPELTHVRIHGVALPDKFEGRDLTLRISANNELLAEVPIIDSSIEILSELPEHLRTEDLLQLKLTASQTFNAPPDIRDLSVIISSIGLVSEPAGVPSAIWGA
ncbi:MAG: radical SAM protein [Candidatus Eisenbacteria sp.]|nr:radical SAM protein [Candidatus Eisenbacteria bacterium]